MPAPTKTWKHTEAMVGRFFASKRVPLSGSNSGHNTSCDLLNPYVYVEVKRRQKHAAVQLYFAELPKARAEGKPLVIALQQHRQTDPPWLMLIDPADIFKIAAIVKKSRRQSPWHRVNLLKGCTSSMPDQSASRGKVKCSRRGCQRSMNTSREQDLSSLFSLEETQDSKRSRLALL